jgi:hypothetical protein
VGPGHARKHDKQFDSQAGQCGKHKEMLKMKVDPTMSMKTKEKRLIVTPYFRLHTGDLQKKIAS